MKVKVNFLSPTAQLPIYKTEGASCADLFSDNELVLLEPGQSVKLKTGVAFELPPDYEAQIRPRSGVSLNTPLLVVPGTCDEDYTGEICVIIKNVGNCSYPIRKGERIAQIKFEKVERAEFDIVDELRKTERGENGFGHTGTN